MRFIENGIENQKAKELIKNINEIVVCLFNETVETN